MGNGMGWYHEKLKEMKAAVAEKDWKKARSILDEHIDEPGRSFMDNELRKAASEVESYFSKLNSIHSYLFEFETRKRGSESESTKEYLDKDVSAALEHAETFEKILHKLAKKGRLMK